MKTMNMPGFMAGVSLEKSNKSYQCKTEEGNISDGQSIIAQRIKLRTVHCECDAATDICNCEGRLIHMTMGDVRVVYS